MTQPTITRYTQSYMVGYTYDAATGQPPQHYIELLIKLTREGARHAGFPDPDNAGCSIRYETETAGRWYLDDNGDGMYIEPQRVVVIELLASVKGQKG